MNYVNAALLGALQGLTEFLPVSSTAHLLVAGQLLGFRDPGDVFKVMIQFGSILAIAWLYRARVVAVLRAQPGDPAARRFLLAVGLALVPIAVVGALGRAFVSEVLYASAWTIAIAFIVGGVVMLAVERMSLRPVVTRAEQTPLSRAFGIGLCQVMAVVPGVSRSGATIVGGMLMGLNRTAAAEFSFFLAIPTMMAAFTRDLLSLRGAFLSVQTGEIAIGFVTAFIASLLVVAPFLRLVQRVGFGPFAWYRIATGGAMLVALSRGWDVR
ncbi:MAG: undecaprenyl-diphosphate phosphatase [Vicinamibacterales bacterium]|nr:undecaprenyl-diphosphate phosphatase [Vicinamibacterales bacterium]